MSDRLPRLLRGVSLVEPATGYASRRFQQWWQELAQALENVIANGGGGGGGGGGGTTEVLVLDCGGAADVTDIGYIINCGGAAG